MHEFQKSVKNVTLPACAALMMLGLSPARATSLADLGYAQGLTLSGACAAQTLYFPLAAPANGASLTVHFSASAALDPHSSLTVTAGGVPIATLLDNAGSSAPIAIPPRFTQGDFVQIAFTTAQSVTSQVACDDDTGPDPAIWTQIDPSTALTAVAAGQGGIAGYWRGLGAPIAIALPPKPSLTDLQTALILSTALVERGIAPFFTNDAATAALSIDPAAPAMTLSTGAPQRLVVPNPGAARALVAATGVFRDTQSSTAQAAFTPAGSAPVPGAPATGTASQAAAAAASVTFGDLGIAPITVLTGRDTKLSFPLPLSRLPAGQHARSLVLYGAGAALPPGETEIITLEIGGNVIWSQAFQDIPALNGVTVDLPDRLIASGAAANLHFIRLKAGGSFPVTPLPFTISDSTSLNLAATSAAPRRFAAFTVTAGAPVQVLSDLPPASLTPSLPLLSELLGAAGANPIAITVAAPGAAPDTPFILVSSSPGAVVSIAPIPTPTANVALNLPDAAAKLTMPSSNATSSILQLVSAGHPGALTPGLWLSPGPPATLAQASLPGDGNVAFYTGAPTPTTFSTELHDAEITVAPHDTMDLLLANWNNVLFGAFWLLLTVTIVNIFVTRRRRTNEP